MKKALKLLGLALGVLVLVGAALVSANATGDGGHECPEVKSLGSHMGLGSTNPEPTPTEPPPEECEEPSDDDGDEPSDDDGDDDDDDDDGDEDEDDDESDSEPEPEVVTPKPGLPATGA